MISSREPMSTRIVHGKADPWALGVLAVMSVLIISTPSVEIYGVPRITLVSLPFTLYMLLSIRGRVNSDLLCFVFAYFVAFIPSTIIAVVEGGVRLNSVLQGAVGFVTFVVVGTYFYNWLVYSSIKKVADGFKILAISFLILSGIELLFYQYFLDFRFIMYRSNGVFNDVGMIHSRDLALYGGRPSGLFSEPSHFARYIGLMMIAFLAATRRSVASLWASGAFLLATRSVSFFFAFPAMLLELWRAMIASGEATSRKRGKSRGKSLIGASVVVTLALSSVYYTQAERINVALGGRSNTSTAVTGDTSLNERIVIPAGYFFDGPRSLLFGLGPTPQDQMQEYTLFATRAAYRYQLSAEYKSAISATILTVAGMGYVGVAIFCLILFQLRGWVGVGMAGAYLTANIFASGYHSTTSLVPSGLLLGIMAFQRLQSSSTDQAPRRYRLKYAPGTPSQAKSIGPVRQMRRLS